MTLTSISAIGNLAARKTAPRIARDILAHSLVAWIKIAQGSPLSPWEQRRVKEHRRHIGEPHPVSSTARILRRPADPVARADRIMDRLIHETCQLREEDDEIATRVVQGDSVYIAWLFNENTTAEQLADFRRRMAVVVQDSRLDFGEEPDLSRPNPDAPAYDAEDWSEPDHDGYNPPEVFNLKKWLARDDLGPEVPFTHFERPALRDTWLEQYKGPSTTLEASYDRASGTRYGGVDWLFSMAEDLGISDAKRGAPSGAVGGASPLARGPRARTGNA
jgi:hypothetical protein